MLFPYLNHYAYIANYILRLLFIVLKKKQIYIDFDMSCHVSLLEFEEFYNLK